MLNPADLGWFITHGLLSLLILQVYTCKNLRNLCFHDFSSISETSEMVPELIHKNVSESLHSRGGNDSEVDSGRVRPFSFGPGARVKICGKPDPHPESLFNFGFGTFQFRQ